MLTYKFNISSGLSYLDKIKLETLANEHRLLYNHLLESTRENGCDFKKLNSTYVNFRHENHLTINSKSAQNTSRLLIANIKSFFALKKNDSTAKFPHRFKSWKYFCPFTYDWNSGNGGFYLHDGILTIRKPEINIQLPAHLKNKDLSDIKVITFFKEADKFYVSITVGDNITPLPFNGNWLSIDPGLTSIITGVTNTGKALKYSTSKLTKLEKSVDHLKSKRDKKQRFSNRYNRIKATCKKTQKKLTDKRRYYHHKLTKEVIDFCKEENITLIIHGDIQTKSLTKSKFAHKGMNKATQNRGTLSRVKTFLAYKAEKAGMTHVLQNEAYTSKTNCLTGEIMQNINLSTRTLDIEGVALDRDINGAINISQKYFASNQSLGTWSAHLEWIKNISISERYVLI